MNGHVPLGNEFLVIEYSNPVYIFGFNYKLPWLILIVNLISGDPINGHLLKKSEISLILIYNVV